MKNYINCNFVFLLVLCLSLSSCSKELEKINEDFNHEVNLKSVEVSSSNLDFISEIRSNNVITLAKGYIYICLMKNCLKLRIFLT